MSKLCEQVTQGCELGFSSLYSGGHISYHAGVLKGLMLYILNVASQVLGRG
jgi:hypothetical protein